MDLRMMDDPLDAMAPWDAAVWFQPIKETVFTSVAVGKQVVVGDPMRVVLIFSAPQLNSTVPVSINPKGTSQVGLSVGGNIPVILTFAEHGPLVQQAWYAFSTGTTTLVVHEVSLKEWPKRRPKAAQLVPYVADIEAGS